MNRVEIADSISKVWRQSREDAGRSQAYMAKALGVSLKTIQNWECGFSSPSILTAIEWFDVLGVPSIPYFLKALHPERFNEADCYKELCNIIKMASPHLQNELLYMLTGKHGSEPSAVLEMLTAHLHVPLKDRLNIAHNIVTNYEIGEEQGTLICKDNATPNISLIKTSYDNACKAVKVNKDSYSNI